MFLFLAASFFMFSRWYAFDFIGAIRIYGCCTGCWNLWKLEPDLLKLKLDIVLLKFVCVLASII